MADVGSPSAIAMSTSNAGAEPARDKSAPISKPERPDEEQYKSELAKAEKELRASEDRMVRPYQSAVCMCGPLACMRWAMIRMGY